MLLVPATYAAGRYLYGRHAGLFGAAAVAGLAELVVFSTNARGYTMITLAFLTLIVLAAELQRRPRIELWLGFAVVAALGLFTVPSMLYPLGGVALWIAASAALGDTGAPPLRILRGLALTLGAAALLTALLYTPILLGAGVHALVGNQYVSAEGTDDFLLGLRLLPGWLWNDWTLGVPGWGRLVLPAAVCAGIVFHRRLAFHRVPLWLTTLACSFLLLLLTRRVPGIRIWLFLLPLAGVIAGAGLAQPLGLIPQRRREAAAALLAVALTLGLSVHALRTDAVLDPTLGDVSTFRDAPEVAAYFATSLTPGDRVLTDIPVDAPLEYYFGRLGVPRSYLAWDSMRSTATARLEGGERLIVVVNPVVGQTFGSVLRVNGVDPDALIEATAPRTFAHGASLHFLRWRSPAGG